jgi:hypothetical protein
VGCSPRWTLTLAEPQHGTYLGDVKIRSAIICFGGQASACSSPAAWHTPLSLAKGCPSGYAPWLVHSSSTQQCHWQPCPVRTDQGTPLAPTWASPWHRFGHPPGTDLGTPLAPIRAPPWHCMHHLTPFAAGQLELNEPMATLLLPVGLVDVRSPMR